jgi:molybdopterin synthase catalytic subunit
MFSFVADPIDTISLRQRLNDSRAGAVAVFEGIVRDQNDGRAVTLLEYEAYESLAEKEAAKVIEEAQVRFGILDCVCVHRTGSLKIGETAVWVGVLAAHRGEAFAACKFVIDEIKHRLPIWKKEHYVSGDSGWVNCQGHAACGDAERAAAPAEWLLDILDLSGADLRTFEIIDIAEPGQEEVGARHLWSLLQCQIRPMPLSSLDTDQPNLDASRKYLFVCYDGRQSRDLVAKLRARGHNNAFCLQGGSESLRRKNIA